MQEMTNEDLVDAVWDGGWNLDYWKEKVTNVSLYIQPWDWEVQGD